MQVKTLFILLCLVTAFNCEIHKPQPSIQQAAGYIVPVEIGLQGHHHEQIHHPMPYKFGYEIKDPHSGRSFRHESSDALGNKRGSYGYHDPWGLFRVVDYVADKGGFRAKIRTNEPGMTNTNPAHIVVFAQPSPFKGEHLRRKASIFIKPIAQVLPAKIAIGHGVSGLNQQVHG